MPDETALSRQWLLLKALSNSRVGLTVRAMAVDAGVNAKTIRRDLELFRRHGFPLVEELGPYGRKTWRIAHTNGQPPLSFTYEEALALAFARRLMDPLAGTPFWEAAQRAHKKVRASLGDMVLKYLERVPSFFHFTACGAHDYEQRSACIDTLLQGIEDAKAVHILYRSERATEPAWRDVYPYLWTHHKHALYLLAKDPQEDKVKTYKLDRIDDAEPGYFPFPRPPESELAQYRARCFGVYQGDGDFTVKVRFAPGAVRYVAEAQWPCCEGVVRQRDGSLLAVFRVSAFQELRSWLMSFGRKAVVLEPEELRREIAEELQALVSAYDAPAPNLGARDARRRGTTAPA